MVLDSWRVVCTGIKCRVICLNNAGVAELCVCLYVKLQVDLGHLDSLGIYAYPPHKFKPPNHYVVHWQAFAPEQAAGTLGMTKSPQSRYRKRALACGATFSWLGILPVLSLA
jgi:hypothetical protein